MNSLISLRKINALLNLAIVLACFVVLPTTRAVTPPPDGDYGNFNTAEGANALQNLTSGSRNTAIGFQTLFSVTTSNQNTAIGVQALKNNTGDGNTANGFQALYSNTTGLYNTAVGLSALYSDTTGERNIGVGLNALRSNTTGDRNTAIGADALFYNVGDQNTAIGDQALLSNRDGFINTAIGVESLFHNTSGSRNTATGAGALFNNTIGKSNTAAGIDALEGNTTGISNNATGDNALFSNTTGEQNNAMGVRALFYNTTGTNNVAIGDAALLHNTNGDDNIGLGTLAGLNLTTGDNNIYIGNWGVTGDESGMIRIGTLGVQTKAFIAGISGTAVSGTAVVVGGTGQLGVAPSSQRFKDNIKRMEKVSETILALQPVTFRYKKDVDPEGIQQFGLVAEEVAKVNPALVTRDADGKPFTVRYDAINAMLLNEFLKEHRKVEEQQATITELRKELQANAARQQNQIDALAAGLQKVNARLEMSEATPRVVAAD